MSNKILSIDCCGCSACALVCPCKAISMNFNKSGRYVPFIDYNICVNCKLCEKICIVLNENKQEDLKYISNGDTFIAVAKNRDILDKSSSGGIGAVLAYQAIKQGFPVCGVSYDKINHYAKHIIVKYEKDIFMIQGSKYLQSRCMEAFSKIIESDKGIIFGTPCQIVGLDSVLKFMKKRENFILVDIFCHGVPVQLLWDNHVKWLINKKKAPNQFVPVFRQKKEFRLKIENYNAWYNEDAFYTFFLLGLMYNKRCYNCNFRRNSCADLRIGDLMVKKYEKLSFSPSCIVVNTDKGAEFLKKSFDYLEIFPEDFKIVDSVQEKDNLSLPKHYERWLLKLMDGVAPENLIKQQMIIKRIKSLIKNRILKKFISQGIDSLANVVSENTRGD